MIKIVALAEEQNGLCCVDNQLCFRHRIAFCLFLSFNAIWSSGVLHVLYAGPSYVLVPIAATR
jgi:hypothetical protein